MNTKKKKNQNSKKWFAFKIMKKNINKRELRLNECMGRKKESRIHRRFWLQTI